MLRFFAIKIALARYWRACRLEVKAARRKLKAARALKRFAAPRQDAPRSVRLVAEDDAADADIVQFGDIKAPHRGKVKS